MAEGAKRLVDAIESMEETLTQRIDFLGGGKAAVLKLIYFRKNGIDDRPIRPPKVSVSWGNARAHR